MKVFIVLIALILSSSLIAQYGKIIDYPDKEAQFKGGPKGMKKYLAKSINYPSEAIENNVQGKVFVQFVVEENGRVTNVEVLKSVSPSIDAEAIRVVRKMPKWKPAKYKGLKCRARCRIPISFIIR